MTEKKHRNIPVFVVHEGCPHACVFCDQKTITQTVSLSAEEHYKRITSSFSPSDEYSTQIAFFGGSFTAIDRDRMISLLEMGKRLISEGYAESIRLSTRPDAVGDKIIEILKKYPVKSVELGIQSMSDKVLSATERGHDAACSESAMRRVKAAGFELTGQMMTALPLSSPEDEIMTAEAISRCGADCARIYPTVVLPGTELSRMEARGEYVPSTLEETVSRVCGAYGVFTKNRVRVLRVGLCANEDVHRGENDAGDRYHEAIGELVLSELAKRRMDALLSEKLSEKGALDGLTAIFFTDEKSVSRASGYRRANKTFLKQKYRLRDIKIQTTGEEIIVPENFGIAGVQILCG